jgi:hypothetical protein
MNTSDGNLIAQFCHNAVTKFINIASTDIAEIQRLSQDLEQEEQLLRRLNELTKRTKETMTLIEIAQDHLNQ